MRNRLAALAAAVLALCVYGAAGAPRVQGEEKQVGSAATAPKPADWDAQMLEALRTPPDHPRRAMLVFPLVEAGSSEGKVGWDRGLIALQTMWRSSFAPDRLLDTWDSYVGSLYVDQQMVGPGRTVTPMKVENTCATFECPNYTTGTLAMDEKIYTAVLTFHGEHGERTKTYTAPRDQIHLLPCLIAQDVVDYLGVHVTPQQRAALAEPTLTSADQFERMAAGFHYLTENIFYPGDSRLALVGQGRTQWTEDFVLWEHPYDQKSFDRHMEQLPGLKDRLIVRFLRAMAVWEDAGAMQTAADWAMEGRPADRGLIRARWKETAAQMVPLLKEDPYNPWMLTLATRALRNAGYAQLYRAACERFSLVFGDGVRAHMHRGAMLLSEARDTSASGFSTYVVGVSREGNDKLLAEAAADLEAAAALEPRAWPAHRDIVLLAATTGRPRADAEKAWQAAIKACPTDFWAFRYMLWYLRLYGDNASEALLAAARRMAATGDPQACIPRLLPEAYWSVAAYASEDSEDRDAPSRAILMKPEVTAQVVPALERCLVANPLDYTSRSMLLAVAYWKQDRDRVAKLAEAIGRPKPDEIPTTLDEQYLTRYLYAEVLDWLDHPDSTELMSAARGGWVPELRKLLLARPDVNKAREDGTTPLLVAARFGHPAAVRLLLAAGADANAQDQEGNAALHWAAVHNWASLVPVLLEHEADLKLRNGEGSTPLHVACQRWERADTAEELLKHGADTSLLDKLV